MPLVVVCTPLPVPKRVLPAEAHLLDRGAFGRGADERRIAGAMRLAEGVAAGHQRDGLLVVHRHAREGLAHVATRRHRIRIAVRTLGVHVDQAHLHRGERVLEHAVAGVTALRLVAGRQPLVLGAPVDVFFRLPDVLAATAEAEGLEAHGLERAVAGQDHQVGPGDPVAVLLLDRPQQPASLVEVAVVGPAVERREALVTGAAAAATVRRAVGARAVPGHADEQSAVVAPVGRPPVLRVRHQRIQVLLQRGQVELPELLRIVEPLAHRVGLRGVLVQDPEVQPVGPPVAVRLGADGGSAAVHRGEWALGFAGHGLLLFVTVAAKDRM